MSAGLAVGLAVSLTISPAYSGHASGRGATSGAGGVSGATRAALVEGGFFAEHAFDDAVAGAGVVVAPTQAREISSGSGTPSQPVAEYDPSSPVAPGGYWGLGEGPETAPKDGEDELLAAYLLLPLGTIATASGAVMTYMSMPGHCQTRMRAFGAKNLTVRECKGLLTFNAIRTGYGAGMLISGAVLLAIGLTRKKNHAAWKKSRFRSGLGVSPIMLGGRRGGGVQVRLRF